MSTADDDDDRDPANKGEEWKEGDPAPAAEGEKAPIERDGRYIRGFAIKLGQLLIAGRRAEFEMGAFVDEAMRGKYWERWHTAEGRTPSMAVWCDKVLGFKKRKAEYLRENYLRLTAIKPPEDVLSRSLRLGWTKLSVVLRVAKNVELLQEWLNRIEQFNMTEEEVDAEVRIAIASAGTDGDESAGKPDHEKDPPARRPKDTIVFDDPADLKLWTKVRGIIKERFGVEGKGKAIGFLCTAYLGALPRNDEGGTETELDYLAQQISRTYGKRLVLLDADSTSEANTDRVRRASKMQTPAPAAGTLPATPPPGGMKDRSAAMDV
jgi:hypothetical protein